MGRYEGHTPGDWGWFGNVQTRMVHLATKHSGRIFVLSFRRWGLQSATPYFQDRKRCIIRPADQFANPDHNGDFFQIDHPDARLLEDAPKLAAQAVMLKDAVALLKRFDDVAFDEHEKVGRLCVDTTTFLDKAKKEGVE